jgi:ferric-dicitrate binding protein FerR (iron transport regulator)
VGEVETLVSDGSVKLISDSPRLEPIVLRAGEVIRATASDWEPQARLARDDPRLAWLQNQLAYGHAEPLWRVVEEFNHCNESQLQIVDRRIATVGVRGIFDKHDPQGFAQNLRNLRIEHQTINLPLSHTQVILLRGASH